LLVPSISCSLADATLSFAVRAHIEVVTRIGVILRAASLLSLTNPPVVGSVLSLVGFVLLLGRLVDVIRVEAKGVPTAVSSLWCGSMTISE
jgi:hypothetical protein